jgi:hypothetical protein
VNTEAAGESAAISVKRRLRFPFFYPKVGISGGRYVSAVPRVYRIKANHRRYQAYRIVVSFGSLPEYYGVQGTTWRYPPILDGPHDTLERGGHKLSVYYDGKKVRLVSWRTKNAVYWVSNSLAREISYSRMVAIAGSLTRLGK